MSASAIWQSYAWPLLRILLSLSVGLLAANLIEALNWTRLMARLASPLIRVGHMRDVVGASFSMAFFSGLAANTMLAEAHAKDEISTRELILANLLNSLPTYFLHLPTMFFITVPFIGSAAVLYVGLTLLSAVLRTAVVIGIGRFWLPPLPEGCVVCRLGGERPTLRSALKKSWLRFRKRIRTVVLYTAPIFIGMEMLTRYGIFSAAEKWLSQHASGLSWLSPEALSIVMFHMAAEFTAGLAAAGSLLSTGTLDTRQVVLALLVGNILSTPVRAFRHQFPYYAGIFKPGLAMRLIVHNQLLRAASLVVVGVGYYYLG